MSRRYSSVFFPTIRRKVFRNMADNRKQIPWPWQLSRRASGRRVVASQAGRKDRSFQSVLYWQARYARSSCDGLGGDGRVDEVEMMRWDSISGQSRMEVP